MFSSWTLILYSRKIVRKQYMNAFRWNLYNTFSSSSKTKNHYETLNLSKHCSAKEIREAFITLSKQCHPDKNKDNPKAQEQFVKVNEAYNVLIKPESRRNYDYTLQHYGDPPINKPHKNEYYEVHRYDSSYRDPWKDPSFARNRNFSQEQNDNYYGVKGIKKQTNDQLLFWIMVFASVGLVIQIMIIRFSRLRTLDKIDMRSEENREYLEYVKARADSFGTRERQIQEYQRRLNIKEE